MRRFLSVAVCILITLCLVAPVMAETNDPGVRLGDITKVTGQVLVRTKGIWQRIEKAPHPVYSTDKVVTKSGMAEIRFVDGGTMRVNIDSNITITEKKGTDDMMKDRDAVIRQVNVLVGTAWFNVKLKGNQRMDFKTPTMTAAIRGTSGELKVGLDGQSAGGLTTGSWEPKGQMAQTPPNRIFSPNVDLSANMLPKSNPTYLSSNITRGAENALARGIQARSSMAQAMAAERQIKGMGKITTKESALQVVGVSLAKSNAAVEEARAMIAVAADAMIEAQVLKDIQAMNKARASLMSAQEGFNRVVTLNNNVKALSQNIRNARKLSSIKAMANASKTMSNAAKANASVIKATSQVVIASVAGDNAAEKLATESVNKAQQSTNRAESQSSEAMDLSNRVEQATNDAEADAMATASEVVANASETNADAAEAFANVAVEATAQSNLELAQETAQSVEASSDTANQAADSVDQALASGDTAALEQMADVSEQAAEASGSIVEQNIIADQPVSDATETPTEEAPVEEVPLEEVPVEEVPVDEAPVEEPVLGPVDSGGVSTNISGYTF